MRAINNIVIHCTATRPAVSVASIQRYWKNQLGWKNPGYHFIITELGLVNPLQPIEKIANGAAGHNHDSIHISYVGGVDMAGRPKDTRNDRQRKAMLDLVKQMHRQFPAAKILGHRDFQGVKKACPSFSVAEWLKEVGL